jgi:hypothetical protein
MFQDICPRVDFFISGVVFSGSARELIWLRIQKLILTEYVVEAWFGSVWPRKWNDGGL